MIEAFLGQIEGRRRFEALPGTFSSLQSRLLFIKRRKHLLALALLASPWLFRLLRERYEQYQRRHRQRNESFTMHLVKAEQQQAKSGKVAVDMQFVEKLMEIMKILIPSWTSYEALLVLTHSGFLVLRTYLSVVVARIDGRIVKDLVAGNGREFLIGLGYWFAIAVPATFTNSMLRYFQSKISLAFRSNLTNHVHNVYMSDMTFYKTVQLDTRIKGPDHLICNDVSRFCDSLSSLYSNLAKPVLDTVIFNYQLTKSIGGKGMMAIGLNYVFTAWLLRKVTPSFGKLAAVEAKLEGDFRSAHSRLVTNAEEISFYHGGNRELGILDKLYRTLIRHVNRIYRIRILYNMFEDFLIKYTWSAVGLLVCSLPVFFPQYAGSRNDSSTTGSRTQRFITNKRLMISLADAGGRIMYSYKELSELAGYTHRVHELLTVLENVAEDIYVRENLPVSMEELNSPSRPQNYDLNDVRGVLRKTYDGVRMKNVPIVTPPGEVLISNLSMDIRPGMHVLISGSNGCGKTSILRIISGLWPVFRGTVYRPADENIIFIPQRSYLSIGTLRDQIIYPDTKEQMTARGLTDADLMEILKSVHLEYLPDREGGFDTRKEWKDVFSGGEKQRMNLARLFYFKPKFGVLDECTSAISTDVEGLMYTRAKDIGITLITISHRPSLLKHHKFLLRIDETGGYEFNQLGTQKALKSVDAEIRDLEQRVKEEPLLKHRLSEINSLLGVKLFATKK